MQEQFNYKQINWIDGMKINKDHFIGLENYFTYCDAEIRKIWMDQYSYGLLPLSSSRDTNLEFDAVIDDQYNLKVMLIKCQAINPEGYRIDISGDKIETLFNLSEFQEKEFYIAISVNPFSRIPSGQAGATENPLRQPFVAPEYKLHLVPATVNLSSGLAPEIMLLGKISVVNNRPEIDRSYIPPCASIKSHAELLKFYEFVYQSVISLERNIVELISEINLKTTSNALINVILHVADSALYFLNGEISNYKWFMASKPPVVLISSIVNLARSVKNAFDTRTPEEREKLLNYLSEHFDINPAKFKQLLESTIAIDYQHTQINQSLEKAEDFINVYSQIVNELKKMDFIVGDKRKKRIDIIIR
jgi:hypothetical protein